MTTQVWERWEVEAYLAVNPNHPEWARVVMTAITGWVAWHKDPRRVRDGVYGGHMYADSFAFGLREDAETFWKHISRFKQKYDLRIVSRVYVQTDEVAFGPRTKG